MQLALVSDVHANLEALEVVLAAIDARTPHARIVCAGDLVGYGPDPEACLELLGARNAVMVMGNHEQMVLGRRDFSSCVHAGVVAALWTRRHLAPSARCTLEQLPPWADAGQGIVVCHGDLEDANTYVADAAAARRALAQLRSLRPDARGLICGHTHHAAMFSEATGFVRIDGDRTVSLPVDERFLVNPGSVGQSRDGDVRASYALVDLDRSTVTFARLPYDSESTIDKLRRSRLVAKVVYERPRGAARHVARARLFVARARAAEAKRSGRDVPSPASPRLPLAEPRSWYSSPWPRGPRRSVRVGADARRSAPSKAPLATVLAYRAVTGTEAHAADPRGATPVDVFEQQIEFLARNRRVISLSQLLEMLDAGRPVPANAVVVTFDHGHRSFVENAVPVLRRHAMPVTVYLATGYVTRAKSAPNDDLYALFNWRTRNVIHLAELGPRPISLYDPRAVRSAFLELDRQLVATTWAERDRLLSEVRAQLEPARAEPRSTATWEELRRAKQLHPLIDVGVCTRTHVDLSTRSAEDAAREIVESMTDVRDELGVEALDLAYPFGAQTYAVRAVARSTGLRSAATLDSAVTVGAGTDPFALPRVEVPSESRTSA